jgi:hypothetical protein
MAERLWLAPSVLLISALLSGPLLAETERSAYLDEIFLPHRYVAGKNSFHVRNMARGEKKILLDLPGPGSVRHIWSTWRVGMGPVEDKVPLRSVLLRIYLNGETEPAIKGALDELFQAAETSGNKIVPLPALNYKRGFNLYLPIYFSAGIRIEAEPAVNLDELYVQIGYRQTRAPESSRRLESQSAPNGVRLGYTGSQPETPQKMAEPRVISRQVTIRTGDAGVTIPGPAILRRLTFQGQGLDEQELLIFWDDEPAPAVQAPLRYFFGGFQNAAVESEPDRLSTSFPMPFRKQARIVLRGTPARQVAISYAIEAPAKLPEDILFFHAKYREEKPTVGHAPYLALQTTGTGHFVGVNLFDTGHDHGGGDLALIDAGSPSPRVLHGICGEDYFGFAWFGTGRMTPLSGAPVQERRYRLHLENPYPFHESLRFSFGTFAGQHPKSVAFWYQVPGQPQSGTWRAADVPWNVLGPLAIGTALPDEVDDGIYNSNVTTWDPTPMAARWQPAEMAQGFLDLTYHFRHYAMTRGGTGAVAGHSVTRLITYAHSAEKQSLETQFGHDDVMTVNLNGKSVAYLPSGAGFHASAVVLPLEKGWNKLTVTLENDENLNWRWCGLSLAVKKDAAVRFAASPNSIER